MRNGLTLLIKLCVKIHHPADLSCDESSELMGLLFVHMQLGSSLTHVTNQDDPVPILPPRFIGYQHPQGEIHINAVDGNGDATDIVACPGQENEVSKLISPNVHLNPT